ncbi:ABC transporter permease [Orrella marina]|uniref:ABC transporter permease n=1 Tax=Orrella marina TaxID=2163011 RepID=A0A2R4XG39_9BURK|nr:FtsX-like permease family protein [Orrella marina]AWB32778.1 ABC transporter permease [Orrella marina]
MSDALQRRSLLRFALADLRGSRRTLWVFALCLVLGVSLISASAGLYRVVQQALMAQTRVLIGGDAEVFSRAPLSESELSWIEERSDVSLLIQLRTMLMTPQGDSQLVLLQGVDDAYPLYGEVVLDPDRSLSEAIRESRAAVPDGQAKGGEGADQKKGVVIDRVLADRLGLDLDSTVSLGSGQFNVTGVIDYQPDRGLNADWNGLPVIVSAKALDASGLLQFGSRADYRYRVRVPGDVEQWRADFMAAFPQGQAEVRTFEDRNVRLGEVLGQIGSGILLIGFSALLIGSLGVYNSVSAYLNSKLRTFATLGAIGLRDAGLRWVYGFQLLLLASVCSAVGSLIGSALAMVGMQVLQGQLPVPLAWQGLVSSWVLAWCLGMTVAMTFAWPALARALTVSPSDLFRSDLKTGSVGTRDWTVTISLGLISVALMLMLLPDLWFGSIYLLAVIGVFAGLELIVRLIRVLAGLVTRGSLFNGQFIWRLAVSSLNRTDSPLRPLLLSLGASLTLVVTSTLAVMALFVTVTETVPANAPGLVFYDIPQSQRSAFASEVEQRPGVASLDLMPLVLGRVSAVNGDVLRESNDVANQMASRDEHKLSTWNRSFDEVVVVRGAIWDEDYSGEPLFAMEDREADQMGLQVGDRVQFEIQGKVLEGRLAAIYAQKRLQSRLWLEGLFSKGALDPFVTRYVGMAFVDPAEVVSVQNDVARHFPAVITVRTDLLLERARSILNSAGLALALTGLITLFASALVLLSVMSAIRARQAHTMTILHTMGARVSVLRNALLLEYLLLAGVLVAFSASVGAAIGSYLLRVRIGLPDSVQIETGFLVAASLCLLVLGSGVVYLQRQFRLTAASLLRDAADG